MGLGLQGAYGVANLQDSFQQLLAQRMQQEAIKRQIAQQDFENQTKVRQLDQTDALRRDQLARQNKEDDLRQGNVLNEAIPGGTKLSPTDPSLGFLRQAGARLTHQEPNLPSTGLMGGRLTMPSLQGRAIQPSGLMGAEQGKPSTGGFIRTVSPGNPEQYIKEPSARQQDTVTDNTRQQDALVRQQNADKEHERHDRAMENKPTGQPDARLDRSYQYHRTALDKLAKPLEDQQQRMGRLIESVNQQTPQADALVAPELLTVMAGGAGSGLRMNEAEISRIIGGRSKWETLKATLNQWSTDPSKATSITPDQRAQIRQLVQAVHEKSQSALATLNQAGDSLIDTDVMGHRRVVADARKKLQQIFEAPSASTAQTTKPSAADLIKKYGGG